MHNNTSAGRAATGRSRIWTEPVRTSPGIRETYCTISTLVHDTPLTEAELEALLREGVVNGVVVGELWLSTRSAVQTYLGGGVQASRAEDMRS